MNAENAEKNIWDQMRSLTQIQVRVMQGGVTTLVGLQAAIFFLRKDYAEISRLRPGSHLPWFYQFIGAFILLLVAIIFFLISSWIGKRIMFYLQALRELPKQFPNDNVQIYPVIPKDVRVRYYTRFFYFFFPALDLFLSFLRWIAGF